MLGNYHIVNRNVKDVFNAILQVEGVCPCCDGKNTVFQKYYHKNYKDTQNKYECNDCGAVWYGNTYNEQGVRVTKYNTVAIY